MEVRDRNFKKKKSLKEMAFSVPASENTVCANLS